LPLQYLLQTARLALRPFALTDLDDFLAYRSREDVARYLYGDALDRASGEALLGKWAAAGAMTREGERVMLAVLPLGQRRVIGDVNLMWRSQEHRQGEIGYAFNPEYHGHGYATEAAAAMLRLGFTEYGFHRICARCDARNTASVKVMERLGMRREAHLIENELFKGEWSDELTYAILGTEWAQAQPAGAHSFP
jgi:RimJ/RimL family protein N-acetyltransferase